MIDVGPYAHIHASQRVPLHDRRAGMRNSPTDVCRLRILDVARSMDHRRDTRDDIGDGGTIARCRELLGDEAEGLSDEEIDHIRHHADAVAYVMVQMFLEQRAEQEEQL